MSDLPLSQTKQRARAIDWRSLFRAIAIIIPLVAAAYLTAETLSDLRQPEFHKGDFGSGFSDDFNIDRTIYRLPAKLEFDITESSGLLFWGQNVTVFRYQLLPRRCLSVGRLEPQVCLP